LEHGKELYRAAWQESSPVRHFAIEDLLPEDVAHEISQSFPDKALLVRTDTLRERKYIGIEMGRYNPIIKEITFAFQHPTVMKLVGEITGIADLLADSNLYNSGISEMIDQDYLHPHIDNSSNPFLKQYRRINALYYVSDDWSPAYGGNLELWDQDRKHRKVVSYRFNTIVFMNTNRTSYHSVDPIHDCGDRVRKCVSNYYFSAQSPEQAEYFHVTTFRGRPEQPLRNFVLTLDGMLRNLLRKFKPRKPEEITHVYRDDDTRT
jgi:Rps23 Pro-64 3,4-dihydroxylase Tpa1-like proline 4-hydroxylase